MSGTWFYPPILRHEWPVHRGDLKDMIHQKTIAAVNEAGRLFHRYPAMSALIRAFLHEMPDTPEALRLADEVLSITSPPLSARTSTDEYNRSRPTAAR